MKVATTVPRSLRITSSDNPRFKAALLLREQKHRRATGLFLVESRRDLDRALAAGLKLQELFVCPDLLREAPPHAHVELTAPLLRKLTVRENPEGLVAIFEQRPVVSSTPLPDPHSPNPALLLVAVGTTKPGNLGAMARTAAAAGVEAMLVGDGVVDPYNPHAIRTSTGAVFSLPICPGSLSEVATLLRQRNIRPVCAVPGAKLDLHQADLRGPTALVIGAEDTGLPSDWRNSMRDIGGIEATIPMPGAATRGVDSLNAATAAAVMLFEAVRQRQSV